MRFALLSLLLVAVPAVAHAQPHPWKPTSSESVEARFPTPPGFARAAAPDRSFEAFLRRLPLLPAGTPVVDYRGHEVLHGDHENLAGVVDIDVGTRDLQHCADAVYRLHAEWRWARGDRDLAYRSASGVALSYADYLRGERAVARGDALLLLPRAAPRPDSHLAFRSWLDEVFAWANTSSLERDGRPVPLADVRAGDFFVLSGTPHGHAVIVVDVARRGDETAMLLAQSYMPAQSIHVLRPSRASAWFVVRNDAMEVTTPFWRPFPVSALERLP